eukprot:5176484-Prymnesium_polylepis.1
MLLKRSRLRCHGRDPVWCIRARLLRCGEGRVHVAARSQGVLSRRMGGMNSTAVRAPRLPHPPTTRLGHHTKRTPMTRPGEPVALSASSSGAFSRWAAARRRPGRRSGRARRRPGARGSGSR